MLSRQAIIDLLQRLEEVVADDLEGQEIDFKEWDARSKAKALDLLVEMAVCMANGGGGTVVFGVRDKVIGRAQAIVGIPPEIDINILARTVYDETDPKLTPEFEELTVPEGTGRLLLMHVRGMLKPYTTTDRIQFTAAGVWSQPALAGDKLPATRFSLKCKFKVEGTLKNLSVRWDHAGQWFPNNEWFAGAVSDCKIVP